MPLSYNTAPPTHDGKNTINSINKNYSVRDFLLHRNIQNPTKYPQYSTSINGSPKGGEPFLDTSDGKNMVIEQIGIVDSSQERIENAIRMNTFKDNSSTSNKLIDIQNNVPKTPIFPETTAPIGNTPYTETIDKYGLIEKTKEGQFRSQLTSNNLYLDTNAQIDGAVNMSTSGIYKGNHVDGYLNDSGNLNLGNIGLKKATDILGSLLNGQGVGFDTSNGQIISNFDIRASIAGRALNSVGLMKDTALGIIGAKELGNAMFNNALFNAQQKGLGTLDVKGNILSLIKDGKLSGLRPDYSITINNNSDILGKIANIGEDILGFQFPLSKLSEAGSIFTDENGWSGNIQRSSAMLTNTGKGQVSALALNLSANSVDPKYLTFRSGYIPSFKHNDKSIFNNTELYAYDNEGKVNLSLALTQDSNTRIINTTNPGNFGDLEDTYTRSTVDKPTFSWVSKPSVSTGDGNFKLLNTNARGKQVNVPKKSLLAKTQELFNDKAMKTVLSVKGDTKVTPSQINTAVVNGMHSRGSNVRTESALKSGTNKSAEDTFCRSWTTYDRYDSVDNLIRHSRLNGINTMDSNHWRPNNTKNSVLDDAGFVKIGPYKEDNVSRSKSANIKKYMLSIENLAWAGTPARDLPYIEQGPGDPTNPSVFGRIMWFPPYEINFTENNTASWESTNFIGRGEPIYTYNNSERTGTLSFKIIVDHPSQINGFIDGPEDDEIDSYFAGCTTISPKWLDKMTLTEQVKIEENNYTPVEKKVDEPEVAPPGFSVYFLNDVTHITGNGFEAYEDGKNDSGIGPYTAEPQTHLGVTYPGRELNDTKNYGLNATPIILDGVSYKGFLDPNYIAAMKKYLKEKCKRCQVTIYGYASKQGWTDSNKKLAKDRADNFYDWFKANMLDSNDAYAGQRRNNDIQGFGDTKAKSNYNLDSVNAINTKIAKMDRKVDVSFKYVPDLKTDKEVAAEEAAKKNAAKKLNPSFKKKFYNEAHFFEKMVEGDKFIFDEIRKKIKFFHPAFHSTTPEGLNSRLTFLNQCTRQGPTFGNRGVDNLAFGRPPVCILRIGDFYNTKIIIDNINYDFEPLVWDLNPEGVGVQPMIANVNMSFKFIGGSSLDGPLNKLQNALSFNYYANSQVYDVRADYIENGLLINGLNMNTNSMNDDKVEAPTYNTEVTTQNQQAESINKSAKSVSTTNTNPNTEQGSVNEDELKKVRLESVSANENVITIIFDSTILNNTNGYYFKAIVSDATNTKEIVIGNGTLYSSTEHVQYVFTMSNDTLINGQTYTLQVKFDGINLSKTFTKN